ncbi:thiamine biosynthesis protein ThiS [Candidatus Termititenax dinenymphae]|uniref:Thiamine biosynthesis protein ThiS n=1 Tax=Candidatus Termititenax dinenymphae TaxID=2218523 RepID=A0A388TJ96_9BACT|nr:thiamine biosynthesis protein ThiS [Candidatus Termititenax dinenymphae]
MKITLNGQPQEIADGLNIQSLIEQLNLTSQALVVEYNDTILQQEDWPKTVLSENDRLELIKFCGGG